MKSKTVILIGAVLAGCAIAGKAAYEVSTRSVTSHIVSKNQVDGTLELGTPYHFFDGDTLVITTPVTKADPYSSVYSSYVDYDVTEDGVKVSSYEYSRVPSIGYGQEVAYTTVAIKNVKPEADININVSFDSDMDPYVDSIEDYAYLLDEDQDKNDLDLILKTWQKREEAYSNVVSLEDLGNGKVNWTVSTQDGSARNLYGTFEICFFDGETCIYSEEVNYDGPHEQDVSMSGTFQCPYTLPAYTSVKAIIPAY